jgi:hypothetical protein
VNNNPIRYTDPSGHKVTCDVDENCKQSQRLSRFTGVKFWKALIKDDFGIIMSDGEQGYNKAWDIRNLSLVHLSLQNINAALGGNLKSIIGGAIFKSSEYTGEKDYSGWTTHDKTITFYTKGNAAIRQMNIYHEFGHLIDSLPGKMFDVFTKALEAEGNPGYVAENRYLNTNALIQSRVTDDPNYASVQAIQASDNTSSEQWADIFANYVAGNINPASIQGQAMNTFVTKVLTPYIGAP